MFAKLSSSSSPSWTQLVLLSVLYQPPPTRNRFNYDLNSFNFQHSIFNFLAISGNFKHFFFWSIFLKILNSGGVQSFLNLKSYFFCELKPHAKFRYPRTTPSGRKVCVGGGWLRVNLVLALVQQTRIQASYLDLDHAEQKFQISFLETRNAHGPFPQRCFNYLLFFEEHIFYLIHF